MRNCTDRFATTGALRRIVLPLSMSAVLAALACNMVPLVPSAEPIRVLEASETSGCERLAKTKVKVLAKVLGIQRSASSISRELSTLARNAAVEIEGNAVAPDGPVSEASQSFGIYRCPEL